VIEDGTLRQHQTNSPAVRDMMCGFPDERRRHLLVRNCILMMFAPFRGKRFLNGRTSPRRITDNQIDIHRVFGVLSEEIAAPDVSFNPSAAGDFRVVDQPW
jgi:hypothetical protein